MDNFIAYMRNKKLSEITIHDRLEFLRRLRKYLGNECLLSATPNTLAEFQSTYAHLRPASVDIYTRHVRAFYHWARRTSLILVDPAEDLPLPRIPKPVPHPTSFDDLRVILACAPKQLRTAYVLAAFAGLRCGEICRLTWRDITRDSGVPIALIHGKGGKERYVPLLAPVVAEIGFGRTWVLTNNGVAMRSRLLSVHSTRFLQEIGIATTLHSMRATFATHTLRITKDPLLVRDLLGHDDLKTTQIYTLTDMNDVHGRLAEFAQLADGIIGPRQLAAVSA